AIVASGVESRGLKPVPPVVRIRSTRPESASSRSCSRMLGGSSGITRLEVMVQPSSRHRAITAGPDLSSLLPEEKESLIVITATRKEEGADILEGYYVCTVSRLASSIKRIASISKPVVLRVVVVRVEAFAALKSISNSPADQSKTL